mgnify:CR=1 FL=1
MFVFKYIDHLVEEYNYKKLPDELSILSHGYYKAQLPDSLFIEGDQYFEIKTQLGTVIACGYKRIVIGDYGAYLEIEKDNCFKDKICCQLGQEYRYKDPQYKDKVKYYWYTCKDGSGIKIYFQQRTVEYADYRPGYIYISPHEILT